jgi:hypothetical protein
MIPHTPQLSELRFENDNRLVNGDEGVHIVTEDSLASIGSTNSYTYCFWMTLRRREKGWCSIIHRGYAEFDRCPGLWLCADCNKFHLRVSSLRQENFGKSQSNNEVEIGVPVHVAIVVNGSQKRIQLYMNGELDFQKDLRGKDNFLPGRGPLYIGRDPWHKSSTFLMSKFALFNSALGGADIKDIFRTQHESVNSLTGMALDQDKEKDNIFSFSASEKSTTTGSEKREESPSLGGLTASLLAAHDELQGGSKDATASEENIGSVDNGNDNNDNDDDDDQFLDSMSLVQSEVGAPPSLPGSTATSQYTVRPSQHLQHRQQQREIDLRELQSARKYGVCYETGSGRLVYAYEDVMYVTDSTGSRGITAWRLKSNDGDEVNMHVPNLFEVAVVKK